MSLINKFYKILIILFVMVFLTIPVFVRAETSGANITLRASVTKVPDSFYGTWRVTSKLIDTDSPITFKQNSLDLWNLSRTNNVITLSNPFSGASADITIDSVNNNTIVFTKSGKYGEQTLTDVVEIKLDGNTFSGFDSIKLDTYSNVNGKIIKTEVAKYSISGEKIAGDSVIEN